VEGARVTTDGVHCGWGGVTRGSCRTSGALKETSCVSGPLRACALPRLIVRRARGVPRARWSTGAAYGGAPPSRPLAQRPPVRNFSRACRRRA